MTVGVRAGSLWRLGYGYMDVTWTWTHGASSVWALTSHMPAKEVAIHDCRTDGPSVQVLRVLVCTPRPSPPVSPPHPLFYQPTIFFLALLENIYSHIQIQPKLCNKKKKRLPPDRKEHEATNRGSY